MAVTERLTPEYTPDQLPPMDVAGRAARLRPLIAAAGCDALVVTNLTNVRYLTGFTGSAAILLVTADDLLFVSEINTIPGFTPISLFPRLCAEGGYDFGGICERIVELALERAAGRPSRRLTRADLP